MKKLKTDNEKRNDLEKITDIFSLVSGANAYHFFLMGLNKTLPTDEENKKALNYLFEGNNMFYAKVCYILMILSYCEDKIKDASDRDSYQSRIINKVLIDNLKFIFNKKEDNYVINDIERTPNELNKFLKNKSSHGGFIIDAKNQMVGYKIINSTGDVNQIIWIDIDRLATYAIRVGSSAIHCGKNKITRPVILTKNNKYNFRDENDIRKYITESECFKFSFESSKGISVKNVQIIDTFINNYKVLYNAGDIEKANKIKSKFIEDLKEDDISFECDELKLGETDISELASFSKSNINMNYGNYNAMSLINSLIGEKVDNSFELDNDSLESINLLKANTENLILMDRLSKKKKYKPINDAVGKFNIDINIMTSSLLAMYYSLVSYGLENVLEPTEIDYSSLDILPFVNINSKKDHKVVKACDELYKDSKKDEDRNETHIKTVSESIDLQKQKRDRKIMEVELKCTNKIELTKKKDAIYLNYARNINKLKLKKDDFVSKRIKLVRKTDEHLLTMKWAHEVYNDEYHLLESIKNSINEGSYEVIPSYDLNNSIIRFKDLYRGDVIYDCEITFEDFEKIIVHIAKQLYPYLMYRSETLIEDLNNNLNDKLVRKLKNVGIIEKSKLN